MTTGALALLKGAVDLHRHGFPELTYAQRPPLTDEEDMRRCRDAGFRAVVLKSHMWPTVGRAYHLRRAVQGLEVLGSITLNPSSGGFSRLAVESAAAQGARILFMPTWGARNDIERGGFSKQVLARILRHADLDGHAGLSVLDEHGLLRQGVREVLTVAAEHRMVVFTGHLAPAESLVIARSGLAEDRLVFSHPDSHSVGATRAHLHEMAELGATIEICALGLHPRVARVTAKELADVIADVSAARCVLTSDYFFDWAPPSAEAIAGLADCLLEVGVSAEDVRRMACDNPARLLGLDDRPASGATDA